MQTSGPSTPALSIIVPTYQESANIPILFERIKVVLDGLPWEMIVVDDDSPDGTSNVAFALAAKDNRLRCLRRVNRSGLAGAVIEERFARMVFHTHRRSCRDGSDERLLHDSARNRLSSRSASFARRFQDSGRCD